MHIPRRGGEPVFVDATGRRRRLLVVLGVSGGVALLLAALALLAGFTGVGPGGLPGWPGSDAGRVQGAGTTHGDDAARGAYPDTHRPSLEEAVAVIRGLGPCRATPRSPTDGGCWAAGSTWST